VTRALLVLVALSSGACGPHGGRREPVARPVPVEIDWPDGGAAPAASDAGVAGRPTPAGPVTHDG
jgi:hypothetical protein